MEHNKIPVDGQYRVIGFVNTGNCCFLNASMQMIRAIAPLRYLSSQQLQGNCLQSIREATNARLLTPNTSFWQIVELYLGYTPRAIRQNCACEFLRFFLMNLDEELEGKHTRLRHDDDTWLEASQRNISQSVNFRAKGKSVLFDLMGLCLKTEARARGHSSITYQEELIIALQVEDKLFTALDKFFSANYINSFLVDGVPTSCKAGTLIERYSSYLIFHIQRFRMENGRVVKIKRFVEYPKNFVIPSKYLTPGLRLAVESGHEVAPSYGLKAIIEHHGDSANSGHYTCVVLNEGSWLHADDQVIRPVNMEFVRNRMAYVLLYQQIGKEYV